MTRLSACGVDEWHARLPVVWVSGMRVCLYAHMEMAVSRTQEKWRGGVTRLSACGVGEWHVRLPLCSHGDDSFTHTRTMAWGSDALFPYL